MILLKVLNTLLSNLNVSKCLKFEHLTKNDGNPKKIMKENADIIGKVFNDSVKKIIFHLQYKF